MISESLGKKYSFCQLIENNKYSIVIPLIQRDYVQGKQNKEDVRKEFLGKLHEYFEKGENQDLDFVYGYTKENEFIPLDGQQRLTTLFLLHTYLAHISGNEENWRQIINSDNQFKFRYEVRRSSTEFCKNLTTYGIDFDQFENQKTDAKSFESYVQNLNWYKLSWNSDPTVCSMINMLYEIHKMFKNNSDYYELLFSKETPVLTFLFLDLENLKQGDELYIKMNARGKMLTPFENFKARFEEKIGVLFYDKDIVRNLDYSGKSIKLNTKEYFSFKIDSVWSNLFWHYRHLVGDPNNYDDEIFNFIKEILLYHFIKNTNSNVLLDQVLKLETFNQLNDFNLITRESIEYLIKVLDSLDFDNKGIKTYCSNKYFDEEKIFKLILEHKIQNPDRVKYYAYLQYISNDNIDKSELQNWMRVVTNLVENKILNSQEMIITAFQSIDDLLPHAENILEYLVKNPSISFFESNQIIEEKLKAQIIKVKPEFYDTLFEIEQSVFHAGQMGYLLEISGVIDNTDLATNTLIDISLIDNNLNRLRNYSQKAISLFSFLDKNENFIFERGILTYGNYLLKKGEYQYNFCSSKKVANYERDYSWKKLLSLDFSRLNNEYWYRRRKIIFDVLDDNLFDFNNIRESLTNKISQYNDLSNWKYDFIKDHRYIDACKQGFIYSTNKFKDIQLLNASQMNHLRIDYHVLKFWISTNFSKYDKFKHHLIYVKGSYEVPFITTVGIIVKKKNYAMQFYNIEENNFHIRFFKNKGYNRLEDYDDELKVLLDKLNIKWNDDEYHKGFTFNSNNFSILTKKYIEVLNNINI
jgi:hypothetical protein